MAFFDSTSRLRRVMVVVVAAFLLLVAYFLGWTYLNSIAEAERTSLMRLYGIARSVALQVDGDAHERLLADHPGMDDIRANDANADYQKIRETLRRNHDAAMLETPVYTIFVDTANRCFFGVTSAEMPYFRHPYRSAPAALLQRHLEAATIPNYTDEFGSWLSAFAVVKNSRGEMVAWVQADERFDAFLRRARADALKNLAVSLAVFAGLFLALIRVLQPILRKERQDKAALAAALAQNETLAGQLRQSLAQRMALDDFRKEMVANLSHDLRTPMASVLGYLETLILKKEQLSAAEQARFLSVALAEAKRLERLVSDLFDLSKLESEQVALAPEPFPMAELAQDVLQKYQIQAEAAGVRLLTEFADDLPFALADIRWTDRVLQNLLDNALRHAGAGGFVKFTVFETGGKLQVKVCNSGPPIPEAHLGRVFDRYFRSADRRRSGTGLGLAIVKKIIELHGERVWAEAGEDITTFRFTVAVFR